MPTLFALPYCLFKGHMWHEGDDTLQTIAGDPRGPFHFGAFVWTCLRCGTSTEEGEAPPANSSWDHSWCSPDEDPHKWPGEQGTCFRAYRSRKTRAQDQTHPTSP